MIFFSSALDFVRAHALQTIQKTSFSLSSSKLASSSRPAAGARYRGNATRYALPRPRHAAAFAKLAGLCGKVSAPRPVAEAAKAMLRAVLSSESSSKAKASTATSSTVSPPPPPALPHALLGGACLLLAARRERAPLYPADVAAALAVEPLRLARAAAAAAEAARASEGSAAPVGAEAFLRRELPGLLRVGSSRRATNCGGSGAAVSSSAEAAATAIARTLEDASALVRWVAAGACPVKITAHGPTLAAGASLLAAAARGVRVLGDGGPVAAAAVAAAFRLASAADAARCEAALRKGLCRLAAARLPWLRKIRAKDVERHARALFAAAREAAAEAEEQEHRRRRQEGEEAQLRVTEGEDNDGETTALAAVAARPSSKQAHRERGGQNDGEEEEEEEDELDVIREEDWGLYVRRPQEVALAAVELAAREKRDSEAEAEAEDRGERSGVATPVQRPRKRPCTL